MGEFGDKFRKEREKKELTLDDVSKVTKIGSRMLQAIEEEHFDQLPGGVFNKGFIRAYAKQLGLDPEEAITDYLALQRDAQIASQQAFQAEQTPTKPLAPVKIPASKATKTDPKPTKSTQAEDLPELRLPRADEVRSSHSTYTPSSSGGISWPFLIGAAVLLVVLTFLWTRHSLSPRPQDSKAATPAQSAPAPAPPVSTQPAAPASAGSGAHPFTSTSEQPPTATPSQTTTQSTTGAATPEVEEKNDVTIRRFDKVAPKPEASAAGSFALVIRASENSWVSVLADGQLVTEETLIAPAHTTIHASREIVVKVGNASAVSFLFNGKEIPAQGSAAEVKTLVFDPSGLKTSGGQAPPTSN